MKFAIYILIATLFTVPAFATVRDLDADSLPYTVNSAHVGDTFTISGTKIAATATALTIANGADSILFDFGTDTLQFGTSTASTEYGLYFYGTGTDTGNHPKNITVSGGTILRTQSAGSYTAPIRVFQGHDILVDGTNLIGSGPDAYCVEFVGGWAAVYNVDFEGGNWTNNCTTYTNRHNFDGAVSWSGSYHPDSANCGGNYNYRFYGVNVLKGPSQGLYVRGKVIVDSCTITTDYYNTNAIGANNYMLFLKSCFKGTEITNNTLISGTSRGGAQGISLDNCYGDIGDSIIIRDNTFTLNCGPDAENANGECHGFRVRPFAGDGGRVVFANNTINMRLDDDTSTHHIGKEGYNYHQTFANSGNAADSVYRIDSNVFIVGSYDASGTSAQAMTIGAENGYIPNKSFYIRYNEFYSSENVVLLADIENSTCADSIVLYNCTFGFVDTVGNDSLEIADAKTFYLGHQSSDDGAPGCRSYDGIYKNQNDANLDTVTHDYDVYYWVEVGTRNLAHYATLSTTVEDAGSSPIEACSVWYYDSYSTLQASGVTNGSGIFSAAVKYSFYDYTGDSTGFNDFKIKANYGGSAIDSLNYTVAWDNKDTTLALDTTLVMKRIDVANDVYISGGIIIQ